VRSMIRDGHFAADLVIVDGCDFSQIGPQELAEVRGFAAEQGLEIWFSVSLSAEGPDPCAKQIPGVLAHLVDELDVLICLVAEERHIRLQLVKDHEAVVDESLHLALDPKTLLIAEEG
jgi:hypothetical protein